MARIIAGVDDVQIQPAGVDLRVAEVYRFLGAGFLGDSDRVLPRYVRVEARDGVWSLGPGAYRIVFREVVSVPKDCVGFCYPRSSLLRMGATVLCAVWDPGYYGRGSALLVVFNEHGLRLAVGARVAQLVYARVYPSPDRTYRGTYLGEGVGESEV